MLYSVKEDFSLLRNMNLNNGIKRTLKISIPNDGNTSIRKIRLASTKNTFSKSDYIDTPLSPDVSTR